MSTKVKVILAALALTLFVFICLGVNSAEQGADQRRTCAATTSNIDAELDCLVSE